MDVWVEWVWHFAVFCEQNKPTVSDSQALWPDFQSELCEKAGSLFSASKKKKKKNSKDFAELNISQKSSKYLKQDTAG